MGVLVTGGAGFLGSNLVEYLVRRRGEDVTVLDDFTYAGREVNLERIRDEISVVRGSVTDETVVGTSMEDVETVYHLAAETHVDNSLVDPLPFVRTNVEGTFRVLDAANNHGVERFVHVSTDEVYGSASNRVFSESDTLDPSSPYSASKAAADMLCNAFLKSYDFPVVIARPSNAFGPRQFPEKLIPKMVLNALAGRPLPVFGDGRHVRTWTYVTDLCEAFHLLATEGDPGEVYNVASGVEKRNIDVVRSILGYLGKSEESIEFVRDRRGHDFRYAVETTKVERLGWAPRSNFDSRLSETIDWYQTHEEWWKPLTDAG